jgi:hypothetical protein
MTLAPTLPPGRANRKALQYAVDIHRLRDAGYTFSAIRLVLLDAGINVSLSTVKREATRRGSSFLPAPRAAAELRPVPTTASRVASADAMSTAVAVEACSGHDIAEAFFIAHPSNPLLRSKESP